MEIKTRELTEPAINQIQKPNFKNQQLKVRHTFTHTHTHTHTHNNKCSHQQFSLWELQGLQ